MLLIAVLTAFAATPAISSAASDPFRPGVVLVGFQPGVSAARQQAIEAAVGGSRTGTLGAVSRRAAARAHRRPGLLGAVAKLRVRRSRVLAVVRSLRRHPAVRFAEPDYIMRESATPNDPSFGLQWGSRNVGQSVNGVSGTPGADDKALAAWGVTTGSRSIVIGETDTGVDYRHPDLAANIWSNPGGIGGCSAGTHGYNFVAGTCDPMDDDTAYGGHGTHVAGILGTVGNNGVGVAGMNWQTTILPVKWVDSSGYGDTSALISALDWLVRAQQAGMNVRVVNDSETFVGTAYSQALADEINLLGASNILFVTAAGNTGDNNDNAAVRRYPCGYHLANEICVAASDQNDGLPSWANYGPNTVDLAAPGVNVYSTLPGNTYGYISGSSMASPQVAGAAALILAQDDMSTSALKSAILTNVDRISALSGLVRTGGRLNVCKAIPACAGGSPPPSVPVNSSVPTVSGQAQSRRTVTASTGSWAGSPTSYQYAWKRCDASGGSCAAISGATSSSYAVGAGDVGSTLRVSVVASNAAGASAPATSAQTAVVTQAATTFGNTTVGGSSDAFSADRKRGNRYALPTAGSVTKLSVYLAPTGTSGQQKLRGVIYDDSGGAPGTLLATSTEFVFQSTNAPGWYDLTFPTPVALAAGNYWIGVFSGPTGGVAGYRYDSVAGSRVYNANTYTSGPTDPFGPISTTDSQQTSLYATYTGS